MSVHNVNEAQVLEVLRKVPSERWPDVLRYVSGLIGASTDGASPSPIRTAAELANSEAVGLWAERKEVDDTQRFARKLREQAEHARETRHAVGQ